VAVDKKIPKMIEQWRDSLDEYPSGGPMPESSDFLRLGELIQDVVAEILEREQRLIRDMAAELASDKEVLEGYRATCSTHSSEYARLLIRCEAAEDAKVKSFLVSEQLKAENTKLKALLAAHEMAKTMTPGKIEHPLARVLEYVRDAEEVEIHEEAERVAVQAILENVCGA